jgi:hypothetical protein
MRIVNVWLALVVVSGPNVVIVGDGDCVVAFVVVEGGGRVVEDRVVFNSFVINFLVSDLVGIPVVGLTVLLEVGSDEVNCEVVCVDFDAQTEKLIVKFIIWLISSNFLKIPLPSKKSESLIKLLIIKKKRK